MEQLIAQILSLLEAAGLHAMAASPAEPAPRLQTPACALALEQVHLAAPGLNQYLGEQEDPAYGTVERYGAKLEATALITVYSPTYGVEYNVTYRDTQTTVSSLYDSSCLSQKDQYTVFFGGNHPRIDIVTTAEGGRRLLLFKDSYANCFVQFLTPHFEKIILIDPRYYYDSIETVLRQEGITDVLLLYNADTFVTDNALADVLESNS